MSFPTELQERWQHSDPEIRLQALEEIASSSVDGVGADTQQLLLQIASSDADNRVRSAAARRITDLALLEQLSQQMRQKDKAVYKFCKDQLAAAQQLQAAQAALRNRRQQLCQSLEALAGKAVGPLTEAQHQFLLDQWQQIGAEADTELQARVQAASAAISDKTRAFADERNHAIEVQQSVEQLHNGLLGAESFLTTLHTPLDAGQIQSLEQHIDELASLLAAFPAISEELVDVPADRQPQALAQQARVLLSRLSAARDGLRRLESRAEQIIRLQKAVESASAKDSRNLTELLNRFEKLNEPLPEGFPRGALHVQLGAIQATLMDALAQNTEWQQKRLDDTRRYITELDGLIEQGHLVDAEKMWDRIQGALNGIAEKDRHAFQEHLGPARAKLTELRDWKNFAATEKKKELVERMQQVLDGNQSPPQKAKSIRALQEDWKKLGHTDDDLWTQFNELAHKAFEPCKAYFKERKEIMSANLKERNRICDELDQFIATASAENLNVAETGKLESAAQAEWKKYAPVAQNKIKQLQKRFNSQLNTLRQLKRKALQHNAERKLALIASAEKLLEIGSFQEAIAAAKQLQTEWKAVGPSPYKEDRNHWNAFRQACDKLFSRRDEQVKQQRTETRKVASAARDTLRQISSLLTLEDEAFLQSRKQFADLREAFYNQLNPDMKAERRQLIEQFEAISRKYDNRHRSAPDLKSVQLINQVRQRAEFCASVENMIQSGAAPAEETLREQWQELEAISNPELAQAMDKRFRLLYQSLGDVARLQKLAADNDMPARELCVEMEIQAGVDTPAVDKAVRMKLQLNHLKQGFGQKLNAGKSKAQVLSELEMQFLCIGPLEETTRQALQLRVNGIKANA